MEHKFLPNKILIVVAGPTAVGKSSVAINLAEIFDADVFSADSRQIYKEMSIGTAKPTEEELESVKHHFINHISIEESYNVGMYEKQISIDLEKYFKEHDIAVLCGGTGLYIRALLEGLDDFPDVSSCILDELNEKLIEKGISCLQLELKQLDPEYYENVDTSNPRRLIRALSVIYSTGQSYTSFLNKREPKNLPFKVIPILLERPRAELYEIINSRVDDMIRRGLEKEVFELLKYKDIQALQTVGYQEWIEYFDHLISKNEVIEKIKQNSRRYAKRQGTWFNKYGQWNKFLPHEIEQIIDLIRNEMSNS